jgi:hypothetical protein
MTRKSKAKFKMQRKGFPSNNLEDGRPGSSAFQQEENKTTLDFNTEGVDTEYEKAQDDLEKRPEYSGPKEGWGYATFELAQLAKRRKARKLAEEQKQQDKEREELNKVVNDEEEYFEPAFPGADHTQEELDQMSEEEKLDYYG